MRRTAFWTGIIATGACALIITAQAQAPAVADAAFRLKAFTTHRAMTQASPYKALGWQWIGPTNNTGRMTSIAVADVTGIDGAAPATRLVAARDAADATRIGDAGMKSKRVIYVGAASGGVWKSEDRGDSWKPIFEQEATASIGDVAVAPSNANIVWVGTGEDNLFRAGIAGTGVYKSTDAGSTWTHMGLVDTGTIGRVLVHPTNPDVVYVAASGHEWTSNEMRGVFKTSDGGKTWTKVFYRSPKTGAIDLVMDPSDPNTLYAAMCQRVRRLWSDPRVEPGDNESGIWKTTDAGKTWTAINDGLPAAEFRGRIGIDISRSNPNVVYTIIDNYDAGRAARPNENDAYNRRLPDGSHIIKGLEVYRSDNKGQSWKKVSGQTEQTSLNMMGLGNTYSWVFTQIRVDTKDENTVYILALSVSVSHDGGATFTRYAGGGGDNHRMWIDPENPKTTYVAHDGGFTMTDDLGVTRKSARDIHATQFYNVEVDNMTPLHVYGSVQDTGSHRVALDLKDGIAALKPLSWEGAPGGEGSNQAIDPVEPNIVYSHGYYGQFSRTDLTPQPPPPPPPAGAPPAGGGRGGRGNSKSIRPPVVAGEPELRANWMAPIIVSNFDHKTIYAGFQYLYRSNDRGDTWERISPDLTSNDHERVGVNPSAIPFQTFTMIAESPRKQGLIYVGTDDGRVHVTMNDGKTWTELTKNVPMKSLMWVSRLVASKYEDGTVYLAERGREEDDFGVYLFKSTDYGKTWKSIGGNIPAGPMNVVREDPAVPNMLYAGNDFGVYVSKVGGA